ncbi:hypothetical protein OROHE_004714 [Orobanche hederae]
MYRLCAVVQYGMLAGLLVGYTATASISIMGRRRDEPRWYRYRYRLITSSEDVESDTLKAPENVVMKRANAVTVTKTTAFYMICGCLGYAAFGNNAPGNLLTGFYFFEPF